MVTSPVGKVLLHIKAYEHVRACCACVCIFVTLAVAQQPDCPACTGGEYHDLNHLHAIVTK